ncbi:hypothetical protein C7271_08845 [filamentous cyanobacterium CCP5]|nr:hypothetical protein C7271_08845 [filamentous cyanobacterium CCP5]
MKIVYDPDADILQISLKAGVVEETTQVAPGLILDYDDEGQLAGIEIQQASKQVQNPHAVDYERGSASQDKPQPRTRSSR